jgi:hypothetical protein
MLTNIDLEKIAKVLKLNLVAICSKDVLKKISPKIGGYIINMQDEADGNGTHWVSFCIYTENEIAKCLYFDSYGFPPPIEIEQYIKHISNEKIACNTRMIQKIQTTECGWYCVSFLYNMQYKRRTNDMIKDYYHYISKYSNDLNKELSILKTSFKPWEVNFYSKTITKKH